MDIIFSMIDISNEFLSKLIMLKGYHVCNIDDIYGDWRINGQNYVLDLEKIIPYLDMKTKHLIKFDDISWKGKNIYHELEQVRYEQCDVRYRCILTIGENPHNCKYRMIDGRHRITKMSNMGLNEAYFNLIDYKNIIKLLQPIPHP